MAFTGHNLIVGMTGTGKSTLAKLVIKQAKKAGRKTVVLDPIGDPSYSADFQTTDPDQFLAYAKANKSCYLFVDESGQAIGRYNEPMMWLATTSRHLGHLSFFISHSATQLSPILRGQCGQVYLFSCAAANFKTVAEEWNQPDILKMKRFDAGEFVYVPRFGQIRKGRIDFAKQHIYYDKLSDPDELS